MYYGCSCEHNSWFIASSGPSPDRIMLVARVFCDGGALLTDLHSWQWSCVGRAGGWRKSVFCAGCHCLPLFQSLFTTANHCLPLFTTVYHCLPLPTTVYHCLPLFQPLFQPLFTTVSTTVYHLLPLSTTANHCLPLSTTAYHCQPLFTTF